VKRLWSRSSGSPAVRYNKPISMLILLLLVLGYWIFVWQLERISEVQNLPARWESIAAAFPLLSFLTPIIAIPLQMLSPRVLRHLIPLIAGIIMARIAVQRFLESFYDLRDGAAARSLLGRLTTSQNSTRPRLAISPQSMAKESQHTLLHVGGPGSVSVGRGYALVTEQNGHFKRVLGPGSYTLARFEYPHSLVDVRPQERETEAIYIVTGDGIELQVAIGITFQISRGAKSPTREQSFPFDKEAVKLAVYGQMVLGTGDVAHWEELVILFATRELREMIAESRLDELIQSERIGIYPHPRLKSELKRRAQGVLRSLGIDVRDVRLGRFELPDPIIEQNIRQWQKYWKDQHSIRESMGEDVSVEESDIAWTRAEATFVRAIAGAVDELQSDVGKSAGKKDLAIQLTSSLERLAKQAEDMTELPGHLLEKIDDLRLQLERDGG
jgi:hypothetical protein